MAELNDVAKIRLFKKRRDKGLSVCPAPPQCLPYSLLLQQLELKNVRELEDLLIDAVYCDIIQGKLDQRNQQVEVDCSVGRDLGPNELPNIVNTLQEWSAAPLLTPSAAFARFFKNLFFTVFFLSGCLPSSLSGAQAARRCFVGLRSKSQGQTNTERAS